MPEEIAAEELAAEGQGFSAPEGLTMPDPGAVGDTGSTGAGPAASA
jgi:hypothetical protein